MTNELFTILMGKCNTVVTACTTYRHLQQYCSHPLILEMLDLYTFKVFVSYENVFNSSKLKAFADDKIDVTEKFNSVLGKIENIVVKGENAGYQHFLLFPQCFPKTFFFRVVKSQDCEVQS